MPPHLSVSAAFDGGNIEYVGLKQESDDDDDGKTGLFEMVVYLRIRPDVYTELEKIQHMQYFCFRVTISHLQVQEEPLQQIRATYVIENADKVSYPVAWPGSTVCYSNNVGDPDSWLRNQTTRYIDGTLTWTHVHTKSDSTYFSYFPPYSYGRHLGLIAYCASQQQSSSSPPKSKCTVMSLGQTLEGREIDCIQIGHGPRVVWVIHRQHPGETMAEYYAEGLLHRLLLHGTDQDAQVDRVLNELYSFYIVPCMCLDGAVRGHLRTNGVGANLNREWANKDKEHYLAPTLERSPEVYHVLAKMDQTGVDFFLDVHGDEEIPYNFVTGAEQVPNWGPRLQALHGAFVAAYHRANPAMQAHIGYPPPASAAEGLDSLNVGRYQICYRFNCVALTLEMPFKDCDSNPDPERGWTPARARALGASLLDPLEYVHPYLRTDEEFWTMLPPEDSYIEPHDCNQSVD